ncbi:hypothetical protein OKW40_003568 [Paraburkholderia sp. RAU6.4a]
MRTRMTAEQMRAAAARAIQARAFGDRVDQLRMRGKAQIVVAREADDFTAVDRHVRGAWCVGGAPASAQAARVDFLQAFGECVEQMHQRASASVASKVSRVRVASSASSSSSRMYGGIRYTVVPIGRNNSSRCSAFSKKRRENVLAC